MIIFVIISTIWLFGKDEDFVMEDQTPINRPLADSKQAQAVAENQKDLVNIFDNIFERNNNDLYWKSRWADKYLQSIQLRDNELRKKAVEVTSQCSVNDKSCQTVLIYDWVVNNLKYVSDPRGQDDYVQSPHDTLDIGAGDCEDLTAVTMSMLENLGIKTYMILTEYHAYSLACGMDIDEVQKNIRENSKPIEVYNSEFLIQQNYYQHIDLVDTEKSITYDFNLESDNPVDFEILASKDEISKKDQGLEYSYYPSCSREGTKKFKTSCTLNGGSVFLQNSLDDASYVKLSIYQRYTPENANISYYKIDEEFCIILESTAGKYGYAGFAGATENKTKIAIDPYDHKSFIKIESKPQPHKQSQN